ncbi:hypothetical protein F5890DRAFT_1569158 [Lentinula detonsa]|uniref:Uncharacterized protein n=1 Tax=Lentinula detonsa TaxID=2804962 RepID=A0AA38UQ51_9AGAR|nr:hypothetical protein F5890DRAFT_1569158 [Lentinula detonsa]
MSSVFENIEPIATHPAPALYVPVHKRTTSRGGASSRSTTPTSEHESSIEPSLLPIYSIQDLLMLAESPMTYSSAEQRDHLKDVAPEILLGRRQRKALEHQRHVWRTKRAETLRSSRKASRETEAGEEHDRRIELEGSQDADDICCGISLATRTYHDGMNNEA